MDSVDLKIISKPEEESTKDKISNKAINDKEKVLITNIHLSVINKNISRKHMS